MRRKNLSDNQQGIIETYLPEKLIKSRKLDDGMKLVLANIYQFYMLEKNICKKSIFRTNRSFMRDIEAKDHNELHRPLIRLIKNGFITRKTGNSDEKVACEYTLMPQFYEMLPDCFKADSIEVSDDFENSKVPTDTDTDTDTDADEENTGVYMSTGTRDSRDEGEYSLNDEIMKLFEDEVPGPKYIDNSWHPMDDENLPF